MRLVGVLFLFALFACGASAEQLQTRAAFDLNCPAQQISVIELDGRTRGVTGCGQRATYVESCDRVDGYGKHGCTWVLNDARNSK